MLVRFNREICIMERNNHWIEAANLLYYDWEKDPYEINKLLCAGLEIWYILVFNERLNIHIDFSSYKDKLNRIFLFGLRAFSKDARFLSYFGYCIDIAPYLFMCSGSSDEFDELREQGISMIDTAYLLSPDDVEVMVFFAKTHEIQIDDSKPNANFQQWGDSAVSNYFKRILSETD